MGTPYKVGDFRVGKEKDDKGRSVVRVICEKDAWSADLSPDHARSLSSIFNGLAKSVEADNLAEDIDQLRKDFPLGCTVVPKELEDAVASEVRGHAIMSDGLKLLLIREGESETVVGFWRPYEYMVKEPSEDEEEQNAT